MGSRYTTLVYTEVRLMPRDDILVRVFALLSEILLFNVDNPFQLSSRLCDILCFRRLVELGESLQK
jgi:hypothetical protein